MTLHDKRESLRKAVHDLGIDVAGMSAEERQDRLIDVGFAASAIDVAAVDDLNAAEIKANNDSLVKQAEGIVEASDERDELALSLPSRARAIANRQRL